VGLELEQDVEQDVEVEEEGLCVDPCAS